MERPFIRPFVFVLAFARLAAPTARAAQPMAKSIAHDASAHDSWADVNREKWRKKLVAKKPAKKTILLAPLRTR